MSTAEAVEAALAEIVDPCSAATGSNLDIVAMGLIDSITVDEGAVTVSMRLTSPACTMVPYFRRQVEARVGALPDVASVTLETDVGLTWHSDMMTDEAQARRQEVFDDQAARYADELPTDPEGGRGDGEYGLATSGASSR